MYYFLICFFFIVAKFLLPVPAFKWEVGKGKWFWEIRFSQKYTSIWIVWEARHAASHYFKWVVNHWYFFYSFRKESVTTIWFSSRKITEILLVFPVWRYKKVYILNPCDTFQYDPNVRPSFMIAFKYGYRFQFFVQVIILCFWNKKIQEGTRIPRSIGLGRIRKEKMLIDNSLDFR